MAYQPLYTLVATQLRTVLGHRSRLRSTAHKNATMNGSTDLSKLGPLEVIYQGADQVLQKAQGLVGAEKVSDFVASVRWSEPFIGALLLAQILLIAFTYATRKHEVLQFGILLLLTAVTLSAERLNDYGRRHWNHFATQDYFDGPGLFMMVFVSGPFVVQANFIVVRYWFLVFVFA